jgi:hypothetical protein
MSDRKQSAMTSPISIAGGLLFVLVEVITVLSIRRMSPWVQDRPPWAASLLHVFIYFLPILLALPLTALLLAYRRVERPAISGSASAAVLPTLRHSLIVAGAWTYVALAAVTGLLLLAR